MNSSNDVFDSGEPEIFRIQTHAHGPVGSLPLTEEMLLSSPSGDLFGMTQNVGMGWNATEAGQKQFLHALSCCQARSLNLLVLGPKVAASQLQQAQAAESSRAASATGAGQPRQGTGVSHPSGLA